MKTKTFSAPDTLAQNGLNPYNVEMNDIWQEQIKTPTETSLKRLATIVYALQAASLFTGALTLFAGIIINYVRQEDVQGTWLESHFRWQIRTFWFTLLWLVIGVATLIFLVGKGVLLAATVWLLYRVVKGWVYLSEQRPMPS